MILIEDITTIDFPLAYYGVSAEELVGREDELIRSVEGSRQAWKITNSEIPIAVCGIHTQSLLGTPIFWFVMLEGFSKHLISSLLGARKAVKILAYLYPAAVTLVQVGNSRAELFAEKMGFIPTDEKCELPLGIYQVYRVMK